MKCEAAGLGNTHFITKSEHVLGRDGPIFLFARAMRDRPTSVADIDKKKDVIHIILTGWRGQYNLKHPRYYKIGYSSHSSPEDLEQMVKGVSPGKLVFNLPNKPEYKSDRHRQEFQLRLITKYTQ